MTTITTTTQDTHSNNLPQSDLNQAIRKALATHLHHKADLICYEAERLSNGIHYLFEKSPLLHIEDVNVGWMAVQPTIAAIMYNSSSRVIAITTDLCIVIGNIIEDKISIDLTNVYYTPGIPPVYMLQHDVLLIKVIH